MVAPGAGPASMGNERTGGQRALTGALATGLRRSAGPWIDRDRPIKEPNCRIARQRLPVARRRCRGIQSARPQIQLQPLTSRTW